MVDGVRFSMPAPLKDDQCSASLGSVERNSLARCCARHLPSRRGKLHMLHLPGFRRFGGLPPGPVQRHDHRSGFRWLVCAAAEQSTAAEQRQQRKCKPFPAPLSRSRPSLTGRHCAKGFMTRSAIHRVRSWISRVAAGQTMGGAFKGLLRPNESKFVPQRP